MGKYLVFDEAVATLAVGFRGPQPGDSGHGAKLGKLGGEVAGDDVVVQRPDVDAALLGQHHALQQLRPGGLHPED